jgi:hypothetical protein
MRPFASLQLLASVTTALISSVANASITTNSFSEVVRERRLIKTNTADVATLAALLARPGLSITNAQIIQGDPSQFGIFQEGSPSIGINTGVIISSGSVNNAVGPNTIDSATTQFNTPGYAPLDALLTSTAPSFDAAVLQIDFVCDSGISEEFHLEYVWASEEYNE